MGQNPNEGSTASTITYNPFQPPGATRLFTFVPDYPARNRWSGVVASAPPAATQTAPEPPPAAAEQQPVAAPTVALGVPVATQAGPAEAKGWTQIVSSGPQPPPQNPVPPNHVFMPPGARPDQVRSFG